jgi:hypothetical protein
VRELFGAVREARFAHAPGVFLVSWRARRLHCVAFMKLLGRERRRGERAWSVNAQVMRAGLVGQ